MLMAASEDFDRRLQRAMRQKFRAPIKEIRFAGIKFRGTLVLAHGLKSIVLLGNLGQQMMQIGAVLSSEGGFRCRTSLGSLPTAR